MSHQQLEMQSIGYEANQVLKRNKSLEVYGTSNRGLYLQPPNDLTLFLSTERYPGPLTINCMGGPEKLLSIKPRTPIHIEKDLLILSETNLTISIDNTRIWTPSLPPKYRGLKEKYLKYLHQKIKNIEEHHPFFPILEMVFTSKSIPLTGFPDFYKRMVFLKKSFQTGKASHLIWEFENLLGAGPGLTPLGDDIILGILLTLNRGKVEALADSYLEEINQAVIDLALDRTTRLSFSLIVCAADGSADQRLIKVLDRLMENSEVGDHELVQLLTWGSTSGFAVLAGMLLALA